MAEFIAFVTENLFMIILTVIEGIGLVVWKEKNPEKWKAWKRKRIEKLKKLRNKHLEKAKKENEQAEELEKELNNNAGSN